MPGRSKRKNEGGLMGKLASRALKEVVGGRPSRSRYGRHGGRPSHRLGGYDSSDYDDYSMSSYGAPLISTRHSRYASGGPLLSGPFGDQLKWKIGDYIVRKFANPKSLMAFIPGMKGDSTSDESSDNSSSDSDDGKHSRRKPRNTRRRHDTPRRAHRKRDDDSSSDSGVDEGRRHGRRSRTSHQRSSKRRPDKEERGSRHERSKRKHNYRSRNPTASHTRYGAMPYAGGPYMPHGANTMSLPYR